MTRETWVYTEGGRPLPQPRKVGVDWTDPGRQQGQAPVTDLYMDGVRATDGTDIGSRAKRREYMRRHNLADADDFKETWAKAARERAKVYSGEAGHEERKQAVARAIAEARRRR